ncbi:MAG: lipoyl synthase [Oligoflexales bacterium]|nr:lipoyl synthase [Oligoflexales bacterium]
MQDQKNPLHIGKPSWLKTPLPSGKVFFDIKKDLRSKNLVTVCEEAKCPNISSCWSSQTATFMVLGDTCTRACRFCHIKTHSAPPAPDAEEPEKVAKSCELLKLKYVVITMVDRDDLPDGGVAHVLKVVDRVRELNPGIKVELLVGDFNGREDAIQTILSSRLEVYAHNLETIERLTPRVRDARASYKQSLQVLKRAKELADYPVFTKSSLMLGLGETYEEVLVCLEDMRSAHVDFLTLGQYMRPTQKHLSIKEWVHPEIFERLAVEAKNMGFISVASSPLVRSSYRAREFYEEAMLSLNKSQLAAVQSSQMEQAELSQVKHRDSAS